MLNARQMDLPGFNVWRRWPDKGKWKCAVNETMYLYAHIPSEVDDTGEAPSEIFSTNMEPYMRFVLDCPQVYINGQNRVEALWSTLIWVLGLDVDAGVCHPAPNKCAASFRSWLAITICKQVQTIVHEGSRKRRECFRAMPNLVKVAINDLTGTIPRIFELRVICEDNGVLEDGLDLHHSPVLFGARMREGFILRGALPVEFCQSTQLPFKPDRAFIVLAKGTWDLVCFRRR